MGKTRPRNPKKPTVASSSHGSKAPGLPRAKKKKRDIVHLGDDGEHSGTHDKQRTKDEQNEHNAPNKKKEARKKRSVLGFVVGASACLAIWGWAVVQGITKRKRDHDILAKMSRRPLGKNAGCKPTVLFDYLYLLKFVGHFVGENFHWNCRHVMLMGNIEGENRK